MKQFVNKKNISNFLFVIALVLLIYSPTREWFMRQIAFSPSVKEISESEKLTSYNWQLNGLNIDDADFDSFKGKVIFVNFWATWCPPCRAEMPMIQKFYNKYKNDVVFVFVTNENLETVSNYFNKEGYNLPVYNMANTPPSNFTETNSIPASYLIDKNGLIRIKKVGTADWSSAKMNRTVDQLLKE